ncbi:DNA primase family protein, partial [Nocardia flavorosea]
WRGFNGRHWADTTKDRELHKRVVKVLREIWQEAQECRPDTGDATEVRKWAKESERRSSIGAVKALLVSECAVSVEDFDPRGTGPDTLNLANGTLNLETYELRPHDKADMLAKFSPVFFDPTAQCPNWLRHLEWAVPDAETRETIQRYFGYALTTETREQKMLCFYGAKGRNGKGVIVRVMERILGYDDKNPGSSQHAYAQAAPATMLLDGKRGMDAPSSDMARLVGKRFVSLQETAAGQKFSEVRVNALTGGDTITARFMHKDYFEFTPVAKYVLCTNNRPEVTNDNPALWRRLFLVNFPNSISDAGRDADPDYELRIQDELSGILNWMLEGLRKWRADGLKISAAIRADTDAYRAEQDWFGQFMADCLEEREAHLVSAAVVYSVYRKWATDAGQGVMAQRRFGSLVSEKVPGFYKKRTGNPPEWYYGGLALREGTTGAFDTAQHQKNPVERPDPGAPPAKHTAYYAAQRRAAQEREAAEQEAATATPTEAEPVPTVAEPVQPTLTAVHSISALCRADQHAQCADELAAGSVECWCPCHDDPEHE